MQLAVLVGALLLCFRVCAYTCKTRHSSPALLANTLLRLCNTALASHSSLPPLYPPPAIFIIELTRRAGVRDRMMLKGCVYCCGIGTVYFEALPCWLLKHAPAPAPRSPRVYPHPTALLTNATHIPPPRLLLGSARSTMCLCPVCAVDVLVETVLRGVRSSWWWCHWRFRSGCGWAKTSRSRSVLTSSTTTSIDTEERASCADDVDVNVRFPLSTK